MIRVILSMRTEARRNVLAMVAEFEADLARMRTGEDEGCQGEGPARGKQPKLSTKEEAHLVALHWRESTPSANWRSCFHHPLDGP